MNTDNELIEKIANKDKRAFEVLYHKFHQRIYRFALRVVNHPEVAEEAVNDTLYAVWQNANTFQANSAVSTWILGIAYRQSLKSLNRYLRHNKANIDIDDMANQADESPHSNPQQHSEFDEFQQSIQVAINKLSERHRAVVQLTAMGHSYEDISKIVGCPTNTVKTRMFHARKQLKHYLNQNDFLQGNKRGAFKSC